MGGTLAGVLPARPRALAAAFVLALVAGLMPIPAHAAITEVGPASPVHGFPEFLKDSNGVALQPCLDIDQCGFEPEQLPFPAEPISFPTNFPEVVPYWSVSADLRGVQVPDQGDPRAAISMVVEGRFNGPVADGNQITGASLIVTGEKLNPDTEYRVTHPFGTEVVSTDAGGILQFTPRVLDCAGICTAAELSNGPIENFLTWDPQQVAPPDGFIGDPGAEVASALSGSPTGTNFFEVVGPNAGGPGDNDIRTDTFSVVGMLAPGTISTPDLRAADDSGSSNGDNVTNDQKPRFSGFATDSGRFVRLVDEQGNVLALRERSAGDTHYVMAVGDGAVAVDELADGVHRLRVQISNDPTFGTIQATSAALEVTVDTREPELAFGTQPEDFSSTAAWTFTTDTSRPISCQLFRDLANPQPIQLFDLPPCTSPFSPNLVDERGPDGPVIHQGSYRLQLNQTDLAGNSTTIIDEFVLDTIDPLAPVIAPGGVRNGALINDPNVSWSFARNPGSEANPGDLQCRLDGPGSVVGDYVPCNEGSFSETLVEDGDYTFRLRDVDRANNASDEVTRSFRLDTTPPSVPVLDLPDESDTGVSSTDDLTRLTDLTLRGSAPGAQTVEIDLGLNTVTRPVNSAGAFDLLLEGLEAGTYEISAVARDAAGNASAVSAPLTITVDDAAPRISGPSVTPEVFKLSSRKPVRISTTVFESGTAGIKIMRRSRVIRTFREKVVDTQRTFGARWNGRDAADNLVASGRYKAVVTASDAAGNVGTKSRSFRFVR